MLLSPLQSKMCICCFLPFPETSGRIRFFILLMMGYDVYRLLQSGMRVSYIYWTALITFCSHLYILFYCRSSVDVYCLKFVESHLLVLYFFKLLCHCIMWFSGLAMMSAAKVAVDVFIILLLLDAWPSQVSVHNCYLMFPLFTKVKIIVA